MVEGEELALLDGEDSFGLDDLAEIFEAFTLENDKVDFGKGGEKRDKLFVRVVVTYIDNEFFLFIFCSKLANGAKDEI